MSGGVDSSVAAALLKDQGYEVIGVTFKLFEPSELGLTAPSRCCSVDDVMDAKIVCGKLSIPHYVVNFKEPFQTEVIDYFVESYEKGETPNPCVVCNKKIKFGEFIKTADEWGAEYIATGHYVRTEPLEDTDLYALKSGKHIEKDQSYMLYTLDQSTLKRSLFPLGDYSKEEVRKIAEEKGLLVAKKTESQDICFVPDGKYEDFLRKYKGILPETGDFLDMEGNVIGKHSGYFKYTIGQRRGLGIGFDKRMYVQEICAEKNQVILGELSDLLTKVVNVKDVHWTIPPASSELPATIRLRYSQKPQPGVLSIQEDRVMITFDEAQKKGAPGQSAVFYGDNDIVLGGGEITL